jgi:hypothetical protein
MKSPWLPRLTWKSGPAVVWRIMPMPEILGST